MFRHLLPALAVLTDACRDETVAGYGATGREWTLQSIAGTPFPARATLAFPRRGRIAGNAPCNSYSGRLDAPYPWFDATALAVTDATCAAMAAEDRFLSALSAMTQSEISGTVLILRDDAGREMVFTTGD